MKKYVFGHRLEVGDVTRRAKQAAVQQTPENTTVNHSLDRLSSNLEGWNLHSLQAVGRAWDWRWNHFINVELRCVLKICSRNHFRGGEVDFQE